MSKTHIACILFLFCVTSYIGSHLLTNPTSAFSSLPAHTLHLPHTLEQEPLLPRDRTVPWYAIERRFVSKCKEREEFRLQPRPRTGSLTATPIRRSSSRTSRGCGQRNAQDANPNSTDVVSICAQHSTPSSPSRSNIFLVCSTPLSYLIVLMVARTLLRWWMCNALK